MGTKLPRNLYRYFWDIEPEKLDPKKYPTYVISRLFEYGDIEAIRWMFQHYSKRKLKEGLNRRGLWNRARVFWTCYLKHN